MIEWSWRIEKPRSILVGSWSSERRWPKAFRNLLKTRVKDVSLFSVLPEVQVSLANGMRVSSFMTAEGQPSWAVIRHTKPFGSWSVKSGAVVYKREYLTRRSTGRKKATRR
jgi:hypothetical protein